MISTNVFIEITTRESSPNDDIAYKIYVDASTVTGLARYVSSSRPWANTSFKYSSLSSSVYIEETIEEIIALLEKANVYKQEWLWIRGQTPDFDCLINPEHISSVTLRSLNNRIVIYSGINGCNVSESPTTLPEILEYLNDYGNIKLIEPD